MPFEGGTKGILSGATGRLGTWDSTFTRKILPVEFTMGFRGRHHFTRDELDRVAKYGSRFEDPNQRLRLIMLNVIRNKGRFVLPQEV